MRRDKEIAETRLEVTQGESLRIKQKCESMKRQMTDLQAALQEERDRAQVRLFVEKGGRDVKIELNQLFVR